MDVLLSKCSAFSPPSPPSFSHAGHPIIEFASYEVPEQWLLDDDVVMVKTQGYGDDDMDDLWAVGTTLSPDPELPEQPPPLPPPKQEVSVVTARPPQQQQQRPGKPRRRKPGPRPEGPTVSHVEAERQRRDKLNRRFCDLRAAVPTVSRMDKASLLADAAAYIAELRTRIARLEAESRRAAAASWDHVAAADGRPGGAGADEVVEVRMLGPDAAAVRVTSAAPHAPARLMNALRSLELHVQQACVTRLNGMTVQDVVVDVATPLQDDEDGLGAALLQMMQTKAAT